MQFIKNILKQTNMNKKRKWPCRTHDDSVPQTGKYKLLNTLYLGLQENLGGGYYFSKTCAVLIW